MYLFKDLTTAGCMAGFLHHLEVAKQGGVYATARLDEAMANLVGLHVALVQEPEADQAALASFRRESEAAVVAVAVRLRDFAESFADDAEVAGDDSEVDWYQMCVRRSGLEFLRTDYEGSPAAEAVDQDEVARLDQALKRIGLLQEPVPERLKPAGLSPDHWWWHYPDARAA